MIKRLFSTAVVLGLTACASARTADQKPEWINDPYAVCAKDELCAVGTGARPASAEASARAGLAKVFEARIKSTFESEERQDDAGSYSKARDYVSETADVLLNAVEIRKTHTDGADVYALAVLNKPVAARMTREEIYDTDRKMTALLNEDSPAAALKLEKMYEQRRGLNQRYIVLTGSPMAETVTYDQVYGNKKARVGKHKIFLTVEGKAAKSFDQAVRGVLKENGYTFAGYASEQTPKVVVSLQSERRFLKIEGFVKYDFHFTMKAPDKTGAVVEVLAATFTESGLSEKQAYAQALESLKAYLNENILNLSF